ncbi:RES family NAD+ phosphorylase [Variovorax paradoxus]|uniref:RES family NAD+ phosphorylase n=1 Tax=Variovorax paradoxus TaxID=34073 RepID=UPI0033921654
MLESERTESMWVCQDCLGDSMLKRLAVLVMEEHGCVVCGSVTERVLTPRRIADFIRKDLQQHFAIDPGIYPGYEMSLEKVVETAILCDSEVVCRAIAASLEKLEGDEKDFYWKGQTYCRVSSPFESEEHEREGVLSEWRSIAVELVHGRRFFNRRAQQFFESLIGEAVDARNDDRKDASAVLTTFESGRTFYRARRAAGIIEARKFAEDAVNQLGAPPKDRAANNRMSVSGVSLLYVSADPETCVAEIRPSIGEIVAVGRFVSTTPLKFFDFNALSHRLQHEPLSFFDSDYRRRDRHRKLLEYVHDEIARPVRSSDLDYVMTQVMAEFIRYNKPGAFDGISFRSVQHDGGVNFVLFDKGESAGMACEEGRPTFDLVIKSADVSFHEIQRLTYCCKDIPT